MIAKLLAKLRNWAKPIPAEDTYDVDVNSIGISMPSVTLNTFGISMPCVTLNTLNNSEISQVTISTPGSGYTSAPTISNIHSLASLGPPGFGGSPGLVINNASMSPPEVCITGELVINVENNKSVRVVETLNALMKHCGIILPDETLHEKYPALKIAWEDYNEEFQISIRSKSLQDAIDNYRMTESLVKADDQGG